MRYFDFENAAREAGRGTAMSRARMAGVGESDAAIAFGCTPGTMRENYLALNEKRIADEVFKRI